jgi:hypothetical protein
MGNVGSQCETKQTHFRRLKAESPNTTIFGRFFAMPVAFGGPSKDRFFRFEVEPGATTAQSGLNHHG